MYMYVHCIYIYFTLSKGHRVEDWSHIYIFTRELLDGAFQYTHVVPSCVYLSLSSYIRECGPPVSISHILNLHHLRSMSLSKSGRMPNLCVDASTCGFNVCSTMGFLGTGGSACVQDALLGNGFVSHKRGTCISLSRSFLLFESVSRTVIAEEGPRTETFYCIM